MWCPEGFVTLSEVSHVLWEEADAALALEDFERDLEQNGIATMRIATGPAFDEVDAYNTWLMVRFLEFFRDQIRVVAPSGALHRLAPVVLSVEAYDPFDFNDYPTFPTDREARLRVGKVELPFVDLNAMTIRVPDSKHGPWVNSVRPIDGFPLCIALNEIPSYPNKIYDKLVELCERKRKGDRKARTHKHAELVAAMVEAHKSTPELRKSGFRARFGVGLGHAAWEALWKDLVKEFPALGKSGRRPKA